MKQTDVPELKSKSLELKDLELVLWSIPGIIFILYLLFSHPLDFLLSHPEILLDLFFAFSPLTFSLLFSLIYEDLPLAHILKIYKKENVKEK